jgi:molecular chaperone GrpE
MRSAGVIIFPTITQEASVQVSEDRRFSRDRDTRWDPIHTAGGMTDPAASTGPSADAADLASTDMSAEPSSRTDAEPPRPQGGSGLPAEPVEGAVRRLEGELDEARERHLRLAAEFDNFRKRVARERVELGERAQAALVTRLLEVLDDMDRLNADGSAASVESVREAIGLVDKKLRKELEAAGLERIDPAGQPFDPTVHEAVSTVTPPTPDRDHLVSATFQTGYRYKGTLIRPARVQVYSEHGQA